jgi:hypothetical protein
MARTIRPFPGRDARIAASRCSFACPGSLSVGSARRPHSLSSWRCASLSCRLTALRRSMSTNMSARGLDRSGGNGHRWLSQNRQRVCGRETANTSAIQNPGDARLTAAHRLVRRRDALAQIKEPFGAEVLFEFEHGWKIASQLLAAPVAESIASALRSSVMRDRSFPSAALPTPRQIQRSRSARPLRCWRWML